MIRRITLNNFMAHVSTELELAEGLNVLVGPNNCGKSAVVTALYMLATAPTREGSYMLRHGARSGSVTVETAEGDELTWVRTKTTTKLVVNGEELTRINKDQASALAKLQTLLRLPRVGDAGGAASDIHFAKQKSPVFLLDSDSAAARFFASSSDAERLLRMRKNFKSRVEGRRQELNAARARQAALARQIEDLAPLDAIAPLLERVHREEEDLAAGRQAEQALETARATLAEAGRRTAALAARCEAMAPLRQPPDLEPLAEREALLRALTECLARHDRHAAETVALTPLANPPALADTATLERLVRDLDGTDTRARALASRCTALSALLIPPTLGDDGPLASLHRQLLEAVAREAADRRRARALAPLVDPPALREVAGLERVITDLHAGLGQLARRRSEVDALARLAEPAALADVEPLVRDRAALLAAADALESTRRKLAEADAALRAWLAENPNCPYCGSRIATDGEGLAHVHA